MQLTARGDYAVRAAVELAAADGASRSGRQIAEAQAIPPRFLENILVSLRRAGIVQSRRGPDGGFRLARAASEISIADVLRAVEGPLAGVRGEPPEAVEYRGAAVPLRDVWVATRASLRVVLESVTLAQVADGRLPRVVARMVSDSDAWERRAP